MCITKGYNRLCVIYVFFSFENSEKWKHTLIHYQRNHEYHHPTLKYDLNRSTRIENFEIKIKWSIFFKNLCNFVQNITKWILTKMDSAQRMVLQNNHMKLARDIVTTEDFLGICCQQKLFDANLIDLIRVSFTLI